MAGGINRIRRVALQSQAAGGNDPRSFGAGAIYQTSRATRVLEREREGFTVDCARSMVSEFERLYAAQLWQICAAGEGATRFVQASRPQRLRSQPPVQCAPSDGRFGDR